MKKLILIIGMLAIALPLFAQNPDATYVIFASTQHDEAGVRCYIMNDYSKRDYRNPPRFYTILDRVEKFHFVFRYANPYEYFDNPMLIKPVDFLDTITLIDLDELLPGMNKEEAEELVNSFKNKRPLYFIDRNEIKDGNVTIVPVGEMKSRY